ncbi:SRR1-like protein [Larimichthys crocea]|uniref:Uncharacterized protein n=1 Tax=Larimichthys crocea TaxID=215358 RepID=A0ACD3Q8N1_LARCR|nr:SRR1-like protein [Larimichthys crocea]
MSDTGEGWQVARRRKGTARKPKTLKVCSNSTCCQEPLDVRKTVKRIKDTVSELKCEEFWQEWKEQMLAALSKPPDQLTGSTDGTLSQQLECVCYGLGSFSSCVSARYQLAMLLLLLDAGQIPLKDCSVYDPAFSSGEEDVLRELGVTVLTENEEGKRPGNKAHTLLPHALREGPVQQPTVEELEYTMSSSGDNHRKQLYGHEGKDDRARV